MKVIIFANSFWNIYNFRLPLIKSINSKHELILVAPNDRYAKLFNNLNIKVEKLYFSPHSKSLLNNIKLIINFFFFIKKIKPDLVISYTIKCNIVGALCAYINNCKSIINVTGLGSGLIENSFFSKILFVIYKICLGPVNKVIFHNKEVQTRSLELQFQVELHL